MGKSDGLKMVRQLQIYNLLAGVQNGAVYSPSEIMSSFGISRRMLQRDLKDLRDCGLINVQYDKSTDKYNLAETLPSDESIPIRRRQHLERLFRIGTLIHGLTRTYTNELERYKSGVQEFEEYLEDVKDDPENNSPDDIEMMRESYIPQNFEFYDLKAEYYSLFPNSNERTRQRDFELSEIGCCGFMKMQ